jgi:UMF1 family MFS transporter
MLGKLIMKKEAQNIKSKSNIFNWILYDFANSIVSIVFFLYFAQWIVIEAGVSDFLFNLSFTVSAILLLLTVPLTGSLLDKSLRRITGLRYTTILSTIFYGVCAIFALTNSGMWSLIFFTLGLYFYLLSFTFYTPLLKDIAKKGKQGIISGLGITANYLGQVIGLLIALLFSNGTLNLFKASPRAETLLPAVIVFFILSLPMLIFFKEPEKRKEKTTIKTELKNAWIKTKDIFSYSSISFFLVSYFLFNDAVLTASYNFPIFLEQVWHISDTAKTYILLGILITSAIGGTLSGIIADKFGHKRTLMWLLYGWVIILPAVALSTNFKLLIAITTLMGFWYGANWAVSRSVMSYLAPKGKHNLVFAYFGLAERASSFIGPIIWGLTISSLILLGSIRYRIATLVITLFVLLGTFVLSRVRADKK